MRIPKLFRPKTDPGQIKLFFDLDAAKVTHSNVISKEVHTKKKYYHESFCHDLASGKGILSISNIALYVAVNYTGTQMEPLSDTIVANQDDYEQGRYPLHLEKNRYFSVYLKDIVKHCTDIHTEVDHKDGSCATKFIFHCTDNENNIDMYLVVYSDSADWKVKNYLLNPNWMH